MLHKSACRLPYFQFTVLMMQFVLVVNRNIAFVATLKNKIMALFLVLPEMVKLQYNMLFYPWPKIQKANA